MAHNFIGAYGLGYYGTPGLGIQNCEDDMYGCCTTPGGPSFPNVGYNRPTRALQAIPDHAKLYWSVSRMRPVALRNTPAGVVNIKLNEPIPLSGKAVGVL
jgi:hypothetical protein